MYNFALRDNQDLSLILLFQYNLDPLMVEFLVDQHIYLMDNGRDFLEHLRLELLQHFLAERNERVDEIIQFQFVYFFANVFRQFDGLLQVTRAIVVKKFADLLYWRL